MKKSVITKKVLKTEEYVNTQTGELLSSEEPTLSSINITHPTLTIVSYKEYVVINSEALEYIASKFNTTDLGKILSMSNMVQGEYNILCREKAPHTNESLRMDLDYSINKFRDFLKRLYINGIISYLYSCIDGKEHKFILLNPNLARKRKTFHKDCLNLFKNFELKQVNL